jgi:hypothetical protein
MHPKTHNNNSKPTLTMAAQKTVATIDRSIVAVLQRSIDRRRVAVETVATIDRCRVPW